MGKKTIKNISFLSAVIILVIFITFAFSRIKIEELNAFLLSYGQFSPLIFIAIMALAIIISPIPSLPLTIASGTIWGGFLGGAYSITGAIIGASISFFIARKLGRGWAKKRFKNEIKILDSYRDNSLMGFIFSTRLLPIFQFDIISYASGITKIRWWKFVAATLLGMAPITFFLAYTGDYFIMGNVYVNAILTLMILFAMYFVPKKIHDRV